MLGASGMDAQFLLCSNLENLFKLLGVSQLSIRARALVY